MFVSDNSASVSTMRVVGGDAMCRVAQWRFSARMFTYLVDPASSHMLASKIKPCMSQYKLVSGEAANGSLNQLQLI